MSKSPASVPSTAHLLTARQVVDRIPHQPQRQDSTRDQLGYLVPFAQHIGVSLDDLYASGSSDIGIPVPPAAIPAGCFVGAAACPTPPSPPGRNHCLPPLAGEPTRALRCCGPFPRFAIKLGLTSEL